MDKKLELEEHLQKFLLSKKVLREKAIKLTFEEKIQRVIEMQKIEREFKADKSRKVYVWNL